MSPDAVSDLGTILGVWAHPDDEAYLSAGIMAAARERGHRVVVLTATRGEMGSLDPIRWPPERLGAIREAELERSLSIVGVDEHIVLGHPDGGCAAVGVEIGAAEVAGVIDAVQPDTILTFGPDGYTGHPDHQSVSHWVTGAVDWTTSRARVLHATATPQFLDRFEDIHREFDVFFAGMPSITDPGELAVDFLVDGPLVSRKIAALEAQASQTSGLIASIGTDRFGDWVRSERFVEAARKRTLASA
jgi:LmbE family N-acetylglucosaminyl deacetylase